MTYQEFKTNMPLGTNQGDPWETQISGQPADTADEARVKRFVQQASQTGRIPFDFTGKVSALKSLHLTCGDYLVNAGRVLFGDGGGLDLQMAIFAGSQRLTFLDIQRVQGNIFDLMDTAQRYIAMNIHWRVEFDGSIPGKEIPEIPLEAVKEAVLNSFSHRDYSAGQSSEVTIFKDRVEIYIPGNFPEGFSADDFKKSSQEPLRRNPLIASILNDSKEEDFTAGLKRIADICEKNGCSFEFKRLKTGFVVIFYRGCGESAFS